MVTPRIDGIDISHWNAITSYSTAFAHPLVSLKATEGKSGTDGTFPARWAKLRQMGVKYRGAYHWIRSDSSAADQAANVFRTVGDLQRGEFIQLDWETTSGIAAVSVSKAQEFIDRVNQHYGGNRTIVYSSDWVPGFQTWRAAHPDTPLWYANYNLGTSSTSGWAECEKFKADVWQWSSTQIVPGFSGGIDVNHVFDWKALDLVSNQLIIPQPVPIAPVVSATGVKMLYCYIDPNGTVWVGNGLARRALDSMDQFAQYVYLSNTGGGPRLVTANGVQVTSIDNVAHVAAATVDVLGKVI